MSSRIYSILRTQPLFACESTDQALKIQADTGIGVPGEGCMDLQLMEYTMNNTNAHIFTLESHDRSEVGPRPPLYEDWNDRRNIQMTERLIRNLKRYDSKTAFVVVGANHLKNTVNNRPTMLDLLEKKGFSCEKVPMEQPTLGIKKP